MFPTLERNARRVKPSLWRVLRDLANGRRPWPLLLYGSVGTGKTFAALSLCDIVQSSLYCTIEEACSTVMGDTRYRDKSSFWNMVARLELVVVDEIGARERVGDLHYSTLKEIIDTREFRGHKRAIYISNLGPVELAKVYDDRLCSRICFATRFDLAGNDRRKETS